MKIAENATKTSKKATDQVTGTITDKRGVRPGNERQTRTDNTEDILLKLCRMLESTHSEIKGLKEVIGKQENTIQELKGQLKANETQTSEELKQLREQLDLITNNLTMVAAAHASPASIVCRGCPYAAY